MESGRENNRSIPASNTTFDIKGNYEHCSVPDCYLVDWVLMKFLFQYLHFDVLACDNAGACVLLLDLLTTDDRKNLSKCVSNLLEELLVQQSINGAKFL